MQIILVNPSGYGSWQGERAVKSTEYMFPYSIIYLQNFLLAHGIESRIFDLFHDDPADLYSACSMFDELVVGLTSDSYNRFETLQIIKGIKSSNPDSACVVGGKHFSFCAHETLACVPEIDFVVRGEGEITFYELLRCLSEGDSISEVAGISYRIAGQITHNIDRVPERDIERFALDFSRLPKKNFEKGIYMRNFLNEGVKALPLHLSRGCSRKCAFCSFGLTQYRARRIDSIMENIHYLKDTFGCSNFMFCDPSFCERKPFVNAFCTRLIEENVNIKWWCEARVDTPLELLELMTKAGCVSLDFAIESGSENVLKSIMKGIDIPQALAFAEECKNLGIRCLAFFMVSLPNETEKDAMQTLEVAEEMAKYTRYINLSVTQILPGTKLECLSRERGILPKDFSWYDKKFIHEYDDLAYPTMPIYRESLSVDFIRNFRDEFQRLVDTRFTSLGDMKRMVIKGLRKMPHQSPSRIINDIQRFGKILFNKLSN
jgi:anaerobic magnesium-protoporphyrin IX monomethyl ester cyclase